MMSLDVIVAVNEKIAARAARQKRKPFVPGRAGDVERFLFKLCFEPFVLHSLDCFSLRSHSLSIGFERPFPAKPTLEEAFNIGIGPAGIAIARVLQRDLQEPQLVARRLEELGPESVTVVVGDVSERVGQSPVETVGEMSLVKFALDEADELIGEPRFVVGAVPLGRSELIGSKSHLLFPSCDSVVPFSNGQRCLN